MKKAPTVEILAEKVRGRWIVEGLGILRYAQDDGRNREKQSCVCGVREQKANAKGKRQKQNAEGEGEGEGEANLF